MLMNVWAPPTTMSSAHVQGSTSKPPSPAPTSSQLPSTATTASTGASVKFRQQHPHSRSSSDTTTTSGRLNGLNTFARPLVMTAQDGTNNNTQTDTVDPPHHSSSKRLAFFADKLQSTPSQTSRNQTSIPTQLLPPRSHSRADSGSRDATGSPAPASSVHMASSSNTTKAHTSPSKVSELLPQYRRTQIYIMTSSGPAAHKPSTRTYDSKLVSREMHRLGTLAHLPVVALAPTISSTPSVSSIPSTTISASGLSAASTTPGDNPWSSLHVHVLPLFNGEPLRIPIEDLNTLVKRHIQTAVALSPSKALPTLENDASELIASGMVTLNAKLIGIEDDRLLSRVVEIWGFFWDQVLPYVEGVLLPLQTDALLSSLYRTPKSHRPSSPTRPSAKSGSISSSLSSVPKSTPLIDVRTVALRAFRDRIIVPLFPRLHARLTAPSKQDSFVENPEYQQPRLQQMLLVLTSQGRQTPSSFSLTAPTPQPTSQESAVTDLLRAVRARRTQLARASNAKHGNVHAPSIIGLGSQHSTRAPSFLSGTLPRDRRGRISQKGKGKHSGDVEDDDDGGETPRNGAGLGGLGDVDRDRERDREFLEGLRSPDLDVATARASVGGWGLGAGNEDSSKTVEEDDEDEALDWDQAQAVVERMVGMKPAESAADVRRRMT